MTIKTATIDRTIIELARTIKALKALRKIRKANANPEVLSTGTQMMGTGPAHVTNYRYIRENKEHAALMRASMDLSRVLSDLRQGR